MTHLWEVDHACYCRQWRWDAEPGDDSPTRFKSFADFLSEEGDADLDYNLLFRWDWVEKEDAESSLSTYHGNDYYRNGYLQLFFIGQRHGLLRSVEVEVCRADEPAVIDYLMPRLLHLRGLWSPLV